MTGFVGTTFESSPATVTDKVKYKQMVPQRQIGKTIFRFKSTESIVPGIFLNLYGMVLPFGNISKEGLKLCQLFFFFILDIVDISFVNVA